MEGGDLSAAGGDESPSEVSPFASGTDEEEAPKGVRDERTSPDCSEDMEDSDSAASERLPSPGSRAEGRGLSLGPAWDLAFLEEDCFGAEVIRYAADLGRHTGSAGVDAKTQVGGRVTHV